MGAVPALGGLMKSHSASRAMLKSPSVREASQRCGASPVLCR